MEAPRFCYRHPDRETGLSCSECGRPICYECMTPAAVGIRCPEHSGQAQGVQRVRQATGRTVTGFGSRRVNAATLALIGVNVAVYVAELAAGGDSSGTGTEIFEKGVLWAPLVAAGDWWRLFTAAFLHYGPFHLAINMYSLYWVGTLLEQVIGRWKFLLLYLAAGLAGSAGALVATPNALTVGASGAIFGILGALWILERKGHIASGGQIAMLLVLNLVITFAFSGFALGGKVTGLTISLGGHVGGLVGGIAAMWLLLQPQVRRSDALSAAALVGVGAVSVLIAYLKVRGYQ
ncbi:MAG TPA: rhomboid family intramembrane serine protease [Gaiellaceae bacterium]|nr:rhomboid family intramembrane serine protease [Gaiellaceae bacterium]